MLVPPWLTVVAIVWLALSLISAAYLLFDVVRRDRPIMAVIKWAWPITALYFGPFAIWAYHSMGLTPKHTDEPFWPYVVKGDTHCGGGCTLGDIVGEWTVYWLAWTIAGLALWPELFVDFVLAFALGIVFQYFAIAPMRRLGGKEGIVAALKADTLSLVAFEVGLFAWMILSSYVFFQHDLYPNRPAYWFMMQVGMIIGFGTSFPMNWWLIRAGLKE
ncbi:MAG: DUF4396 domain-containing protein [Opitutaceae bacterium]